MNRYIYLSAIVVGLVACDQGSSADAPAGSAAKTADAKEAKGDTKPAADKPEEKPAEKAPACDAVVDNIASFNPGSGASEKKLWNKMCAEMSDDEKTCVAKAKDMPGMKACMKKDKKLEK